MLSKKTSYVPVSIPCTLPIDYVSAEFSVLVREDFEGTSRVLDGDGDSTSSIDLGAFEAPEPSSPCP